MSVVEYVWLGLDAVALAFVCSELRSRKRTYDAVCNAPVIQMGDGAKDLLTSLPDGCLPYAVIEGTVKAVDKPLRSSYDSRVTGVIKTLDILEHRIRWSWAVRWWVQEKSSVSSAHSSVPFVLENRARESVEILDAPTVSDALLTTVYDGFQARNATLWSSIGAFFTGRQLTGHEYVERMLTEGSRLTAVGSLVCVTEGRKVYVQMRPPAGDADGVPILPFVLSRSSLPTLVKNLRDDYKTYRNVAIILASCGAVLAARLLFLRHRQHLREQASRREHERLVQAVEEERRKRAELAAAGGGGQEEDAEAANPCVICLGSPREVLILECGHLCCCLRCGMALTPALCPICRGPIARLVPAYMP